MRWWREYGVEDPDEPGSAGVSAEQIANVMVEQLERLADLLEVLQTLDPSGRRRSCMTVGDNDAGLLVLASLTGRFSRIADVSLGVIHSPWLRPDVHRRLLPNTAVWQHDGDVFEDRSLDELLHFNQGHRYDFAYIDKMLHHLRTSDCMFSGDKGHQCRGDECMGRFIPKVVFDRLFEYADTVVISESYYLGEDTDKDSARGGMLDVGEVTQALRWLDARCRLRIFRPTEGAYDKRAAERIKNCEYVLFSAERYRPSVRGRVRRPRNA